MHWSTTPLGALWAQRSGCLSGFPWDLEPYWPLAGLSALSLSLLSALSSVPLSVVPSLFRTNTTPVLPGRSSAASVSLLVTNTPHSQNAQKPRYRKHLGLRHPSSCCHPPSCFPLAGSCSSHPLQRSPPSLCPSLCPSLWPSLALVFSQDMELHLLPLSPASSFHLTHPQCPKPLPDTLPPCIPHSAFGLCRSLDFICLSQKQVNIEMSRKRFLTSPACLPQSLPCWSRTAIPSLLLVT